MVNQDYEALEYYSDNLHESILDRSKVSIADKDEIIDSTIIDSLWFQIILKSCSFLDEWDKFLGVKNEPEYKERLLLIKKIVAPAKKAVNIWSDMRRFRNQIIAHNFRDKNFSVTLDNMGDYDCPNTRGEIYFLISFLNRMINVLQANFSSEIPDIVNDSYSNVMRQKENSENHQLEKTKRLKILEQKLQEVDNSIANNIWAIPRNDIRQSVYKALNKKSEDYKK
ncbi:hypothetical protein FGF1_40810 [Flavobacteriaceae bacterium GF1]